MAAFSFEKIAPPVRPNAVANVEPVDSKPRGMITQMLDRFSDSRVKRHPPKDSTDPRFPNKPPK